jgi:hypothetical protein
MTTYQVINDNLTAISGLMIGQQVTESEIQNAIIQYANANKGMTGNTFNFDRYLWKKLDLNPNTPLHVYTLMGAVCKYVE